MKVGQASRLNQKTTLCKVSLKKERYYDQKKEKYEIRLRNCCFFFRFEFVLVFFLIQEINKSQLDIRQLLNPVETLLL